MGGWWWWCHFGSSDESASSVVCGHPLGLPFVVLAEREEAVSWDTRRLRRVRASAPLATSFFASLIVLIFAPWRPQTLLEVTTEAAIALLNPFNLRLLLLPVVTLFSPLVRPYRRRWTAH